MLTHLEPSKWFEWIGCQNVRQTTSHALSPCRLGGQCGILGSGYVRQNPYLLLVRQTVAVSENEVRPLLVLVSGAPGSGKTTLARQRAKALKQLPEQLFDNQTKRFAAIRDLVTEPLDLGCPLIEVNTENDLDPSLDQIVRALTEF